MPCAPVCGIRPQKTETRIVRSLWTPGRRFVLAALAVGAGCVDRASTYDAVVDLGYQGAPGTVVRGAVMFASVHDAIASVSVDNSRPFVVFIRNGRYHEKLTVDRPEVHLVGESRDRTIIAFGDTGATAGSDGASVGTWGSFTLKIVAPGFEASNLTVENNFDYPANAAKAEGDPTKISSPQAVAVMTDGASDRAVFRNCLIVGYQDTLFVNAGRHYFVGCRIVGHVDFIFGAGQAVFEACDIVSRNRRDKNPSGYVTAPSTKSSDRYGLVFLGSRLLKESSDLPAGSVRLGRPWHPNADPDVNGSAVFIKCYMDDHIGGEGYARISSVDSAGRRIWFEVGPESRFFEYGSYGPGALPSPHRPVLAAGVVEEYSVGPVLRGWRP